MSKQRLAEIMKELQEGCESLNEKGVGVMLAVAENQGVSVVGRPCDVMQTYAIIMSMLMSVYETTEASIEDYAEAIKEILIMTYNSGFFWKDKI